MPRSTCADAQADQGLRCPQIAWVTFSCIAHHLRLGPFSYFYFACYNVGYHVKMHSNGLNGLKCFVEVQLLFINLICMKL